MPVFVFSDYYNLEKILSKYFVNLKENYFQIVCSADSFYANPMRPTIPILCYVDKLYILDTHIFYQLLSSTEVVLLFLKMYSRLNKKKIKFLNSTTYRDRFFLLWN